MNIVRPRPFSFWLAVIFGACGYLSVSGASGLCAAEQANPKSTIITITCPSDGAFNERMSEKIFQALNEKYYGSTKGRWINKMTSDLGAEEECSLLRTLEKVYWNESDNEFRTQVLDYLRKRVADTREGVSSSALRSLHRLTLETPLQKTSDRKNQPFPITTRELSFHILTVLENEKIPLKDRVYALDTAVSLPEKKVLYFARIMARREEGRARLAAIRAIEYLGEEEDIEFLKKLIHTAIGNNEDIKEVHAKSNAAIGRIRYHLKRNRTSRQCVLPAGTTLDTEPSECDKVLEREKASECVKASECGK